MAGLSSCPPVLVAFGLLALGGCTGIGDGAPPAFTVVTFNTGTNSGLSHDDPPDDGYTSAEAETSDTWYGDGLAWRPVVEDVRRFFEVLDPDVVVVQEIFWSGACAEIPPEARAGFVCETWEPGAPTVIQTILGEGWQVMCHPGNPDKCAAVKESFGSFRGCDSDFCLEGMEGRAVDDCGSGARVARATIDLVGGESFTLVNIHGTSGLSAEDQRCRTRQFEQIFVGLPGEPAMTQERNLIMGDLNTDPGRAAAIDLSAQRWNDFVGEGKAFHYLSDVGPEVPPSYQALFNIDHVVSDTFSGGCRVAGLDGSAPATDALFFDHKPVICDAAFP